MTAPLIRTARLLESALYGAVLVVTALLRVDDDSYGDSDPLASR